MKNLILAASAAAFAFAGPAFAEPGKGRSKHGPKMDHARHMGHDKHKAKGFGVGACPPGLANKPMCMPPGQYKKQFGVGQRVPNGYNGLLGYDALPRDLRDRYGSSLDPRSRYIRDDSYLYRVDPQTMLVQQVLSALIR